MTNCGGWQSSEAGRSRTGDSRWPGSEEPGHRPSGATEADIGSGELRNAPPVAAPQPPADAAEAQQHKRPGPWLGHRGVHRDLLQLEDRSIVGNDLDGVEVAARHID